jgi:hypothetical protein
MLSTKDLKYVMTGVAVAAGVLLTACGPASINVGVSTGSTASPTKTSAATSNSTSAPTATSKAAPATVPASISQQFQGADRGASGAVVALSDGTYQGASVNATGQVAFWHYDGSQWTDIGDSSYPEVSPQHDTPKIEGQLLPGMSNATFILTGDFSNDSTANAVAYTADQNGTWGEIASDSGNLQPSGKADSNDNSNAFNDVYFSNGELETADCSANLPSAQCAGDNRVLKFYVWQSSSGLFTLDHTAGLSS